MEKNNTSTTSIAIAPRFVQPNAEGTKFRAATTFGGERILSKIVDSESGALRSLTAELKARDIPLPKKWNTIRKDNRAHNPAPKEQPPVTFDARDEAPVLDNPEDFTECENSFGLEELDGAATAPVAADPPRRNSGISFPWNDMDAWVQSYTDACNHALQLHYTETREEDFGQDNNRRTRFCESVDKLMEAQGFAGAYRLHPSGDKYIRFANTKDMAASAPKRRGRTQLTKNINGNKEVVEHGPVTQKVKDGQKVAKKTKKGDYTSGSEEQRKSIYTFANQLSEDEAEFISKTTGMKLWKARKEQSKFAHYWAGWIIGVKANKLTPHLHAEARLQKYGYTIDFHQNGNKLIAVLADADGNTSLTFNVTDWKKVDRGVRELAKAG